MASWLGASAQMYESALVITAVYSAFCGHNLSASLTLSMATAMQIQNAYFFIPICMMMRGRVTGKVFLFTFSLFIIGCLAFSQSKARSVSDYVMCTVGCQVLLHDLRPNIGLWWYLFVEMFEHFRPLFLAVFQLLPAAFIIPAAIRFRSEPLFLVWYVSSVLAVLKPYPTVGDIGLSIALLGLHPRTVSALDPRLVKSIGFASLFVLYLLPINWYYWIIQGSGNSNFYYAATLAVNAIQMIVSVKVTEKHLHLMVRSWNPKLPKDDDENAKLFQQ